MAIWVGPRKRSYSLVLAEERRTLYSIDDCCHFVARKASPGVPPVAIVSGAVQFVFHHSERIENGAVDLGQHQGTVLLVAGFGADSRDFAGSALGKRKTAKAGRVTAAGNGNGSGCARCWRDSA